jgi:cytoskeletal protein CcmA (bactofilin family)
MFGNGGSKTPRGGHAVETLVGPRAVIRGDVDFTGGLYVEGAIHGRVVAEDGSAAVLTVAEKGLVEGEVRAPVVVISGRIVGDVYASERVELTAHARVTGNLHYKVVEMAAGAMITGRLIHADAPLAQLTDESARAEAPAGEGKAVPLAARGKARAEAQSA